MEKYIKGKRPKLILIENVERLFHKTKVEANNQSAYLVLKVALFIVSSLIQSIPLSLVTK